MKCGKDGVKHSPWESPLALFPLILFALERSEQRPGEPPATALPPARPRRAPLLSPDGAAAPGTDLRGEQEQSGAGVWLPNSRQGARGQRCRDARGAGATNQPRDVPSTSQTGAWYSSLDGARPHLKEVLISPGITATLLPTGQFLFCSRSPCTTKKTSRARGWSSPPPVQTSWSVGLTTSAP